jgi:hypothetical protein
METPENYSLLNAIHESAQEFIGCTPEEYENEYKKHIEAFLMAQKRNFIYKPFKIPQVQKEIKDKLKPFY